MHFTKDDDGFRVWTGVQKGGVLQPGLTADITITALDPTGANTSTPTVSEAGGKSGMYTALVPTSFFTTYGTGGYAVIIEVDASSPKIKNVETDILRVFAEDFDSISAGGSDWTSTEKEQIRFRLALDGTQTDPTTNTGTIEDILADTAAMQPLIDVAVSTRLATSGYTAPDNATITLIQKILRNRLELADGSTTNWVLYDDDNTTPLLTWDVSDKTGAAITQPVGAPSRRTRGV